LMPTLIANVIAEYGVENLNPGDVLMTNNPYVGGSHLPDMCVITPVFVDDEVVALIATMAHHVDIGGMTPGSMDAAATEIFQEGIRVPPIKLFSGGEIQREPLAFLLMNIRTADKTRGDLMAQVAANRLGERRVLELIEESGTQDFTSSGAAQAADAERPSRRDISSRPGGPRAFTVDLERSAGDELALPITATVTVSGEHITIDLTDTADQVKGAVDCYYEVAQADAA